MRLQFLLFAFLTTLWIPAPYRTPTQKVEIVVHPVAFISQFPHGVTLRAELSSDNPVKYVDFLLSMDGIIVFSQRTEFEQQPGEAPIVLEGHWNGTITSGEPAPPWGTLEMWWQIQDEAGNAFTTNPIRKRYADSNRMWRIFPGNSTDVYLYNPDSLAAGQIGVEACDAARLILEHSYGYALPFRPVLIFYNDPQDGMADLGFGSWGPFGDDVNGRAYPGTNVVITLINEDPGAIQRIVLHEFAHLHQFQLGALLADAPLWWIEGDARAQEPAADQRRALDSVRILSLNQPLPDLASWQPAPDSALAHLQMTNIGASFVIFLTRIFGTLAHAAFYENWQSSGNFIQAFELTFGEPLPLLEQRWRYWLEVGQF